MLFITGRTRYTIGLYSKTQGPGSFEDLTSQTRQFVQAVEFLPHIYATSPEERIALRGQLHEIKHRDDELSHVIVQHINSLFITPFDCKDLQLLASCLDGCLDFADETGDFLVVYDIINTPSSLVSLPNEQTAAVQHCANPTVEDMPKFKSPVDMRDHWIEVNCLGSEGDLACRHTLTILFDSGPNPAMVIKPKDIVQGLKSCIDAFEELTSVVESLALKES